MLIRCFGANICEPDFLSIPSPHCAFQYEAGALKAPSPESLAAGALDGNLMHAQVIWKEERRQKALLLIVTNTSRLASRDGNAAAPHRRAQSPASSFMGVKRQL